MYSQPSRGGEPQDMRILLCYVDVHDPSDCPDLIKTPKNHVDQPKSDLKQHPASNMAQN